MNFSERTFQYMFVLAVTTAIWSISSSFPVKTALLSSRQNYTEEFHVFTTPELLPQSKYRVKRYGTPYRNLYTVPPNGHEEEYSETEIQLSIYMPIVLVALACFSCFLLILKKCILPRNESTSTPPPSPQVISLSATIDRQTSRTLSNVSNRRNSEANSARRMASRTRNLRDKPPDYFEVVNADKKKSKYPAVPLDTFQTPPPNYDESMKY